MKPRSCHCEVSDAVHHVRDTKLLLRCKHGKRRPVGVRGAESRAAQHRRLLPTRFYRLPCLQIACGARPRLAPRSQTHIVSCRLLWHLAPSREQQAPDSPFQSDLFAYLTLTSRRGRFAAVDIAAGNIPAIAVSLVDQQYPLVVNEERARGKPWRCEPSCWI